MTSFQLIWFYLWTHTIWKGGFSNLHSKFHEFEELNPANFTVVVKRDVVSGQVRFKQVSFSALRKYFVLYLSPGSPVLREDFEANMVHADGRMTPVVVDQNTFFTGFLNGNREHTVDAVHVDELWIAQIYTPDDVYSIEPMTHHAPESSVTSMIMFKERDLNQGLYTGIKGQTTGLHPFCEEVQFDIIFPGNKTFNVDNSIYKHVTTNARRLSKTGIFYGEHHSRSSQQRILPTGRSGQTISHSGKIDHRNTNRKIQHTNNQKRSTSTSRAYDTCDSLAIADYETFKGIGHGSAYRVISLLVHVYQMVDRLFRATFFDDLTNMGIIVTKFLVHTEYTENTTRHYNMASNIMTGVETLISMTTVSDYSIYCLAHLTTQRNFGGTLGLAATAEPKILGWNNGICARQHNESRNIGLSTPINARNELLPFLTYMLVVSHEIGHNWGSHHDPTDDPQCSPTAEGGGKYIMWSYSGQSSGSNNKHFSPCSRKEISTVLNGKAHVCFMPRSRVTSYCGNGIVDPGEDCDVDYQKVDVCCTNTCRFPGGAVCSPYNHACCTNKCQIAPRTQKCNSYEINDCYETPYCSGKDYRRCPHPRPLPNNSSCQGLGRCFYGECIPFCELLGLSFEPPRRLEPCSSDKDRTTMCMQSCWDPGHRDTCQIMGGPHRNGTPCLLGYCLAGFCTYPETKEDILPYEYLYLEAKSSHAHKLKHANLMAATTTVFACLSWRYFLQGSFDKK